MLKSISLKTQLDAVTKKSLAGIPKLLEKNTHILWDVWESQNYIRSIKHIKFLYKKDPNKAQNLGFKTLLHLSEEIKEDCSKQKTNQACQSIFDIYKYGNKVNQLEDLYLFLTQYTVQEVPDSLQQVTYGRLLSNLQNDTNYYNGIEDEVLIRFYSKYATKEELKIFKKTIGSYLNKVIFKTNWEGRTWGDTSLSNKRIRIDSIMESMKEIDKQYILNLQTAILKSSNKKMREALSQTIHYSNPLLVNETLTSILYQYKKNAYIDNTFINRLLETKDKKTYIQLIGVMNEFGKCEIIKERYQDRLLEVLTVEEYTKLICT